MQASLARADIQSRSFQMANDVNNNKLNDSFEKAELDRQLQLKIHEDKMELERQKLGSK
jgi:hypothetical protein